MAMEANNSNGNGNNAYIELDRFKQILNNKINEKTNQIFPSHSMAYNNSVHYEIHCLRWVLGLITITNRRLIRIGQVESLVQKEINCLNGKMTTTNSNFLK